METVDLLMEAAKSHALKLMHINSLYCLAQEVFFHGILNLSCQGTFSKCKKCFLDKSNLEQTKTYSMLHLMPEKQMFVYVN